MSVMLWLTVSNEVVPQNVRCFRQGIA